MYRLTLNSEADLELRVLSAAPVLLHLVCTVLGSSTGFMHAVQELYQLSYTSISVWLRNSGDSFVTSETGKS